MKVAVIEGKWFAGSNTSVRGMFDLLSDIHFNSPHKYHYEMFNDARAFKEIFSRLAELNGIHNIYVAGHGNDDEIYGSNGEPITKTAITNIVKEASESRGRLDSVYFGCCLFGNENVMKKISVAGDRIRWVAGYEKRVDFIESSSLDWLFWTRYLRNQGTPLERIVKTADSLKKDAEGLIKKLGFRIYAWDGAFKQLL